jgi:hypothetical protein
MPVKKERLALVPLPNGKSEEKGRARCRKENGKEKCV